MSGFPLFERLTRVIEAAQAAREYVKSQDEIKLKEVQIKEHLKKVTEGEAKSKAQQTLYENVRTERATIVSRRTIKAATRPCKMPNPAKSKYLADEGVRQDKEHTLQHANAGHLTRYQHEAHNQKTCRARY